MSTAPNTTLERIGNYELLQPLGRGGMAEVWLARRTGPANFQRKVVIKRILDHHTSDRSFVNMFLAEARLCARLNHPNIVAVNELGETDGQYYIVMEYVHGRDLRSILQTIAGNSAIDPGIGAYTVRELARALGYAHDVTDDDGKRLRIIHRDVSPSNVVVSFDGSVKLVDFGIAKALEEAADEHTRTGDLKGKIGYMAPEQLGANAKSIDHRVDLWAAGVVLWEALAGRRKFRGMNEIHTLDLVRSGPIEPPSSVNPSVPPELDRIVMKALARDPDERYQSGHALAADLDGVLAQLRFGTEQMAALMKLAFEETSHSKSGRLKAHIESARELEALAPPQDDLDTSLTPSGAVPAPRVTFPPDVLSEPSGSASLVPARTARWPYAVAGVVLLAAAGVGIVASKPKPTAIDTQKPTVPVAPAEAAEIDVLVESSPAGASVFVGNDTVPRGTTPLHVAIARGADSIPLRAESPGFSPATLTVVPKRDQQLSFSLTRIVEAPTKPALPVAAASHGKKPPATKPIAINKPDAKAKPDVKTKQAPSKGDLIRGGQVVDPFE